ncbi:hypothetical protein DFJ67_7331 [Asanoa ferruginea]|uniref:NACHT N-terminal Helical domain-containing protein n=1 Tax=Asanoa ferruginea TaxID=53367 RepID=A0A3E0A4I4_9ACTN|nr:hypothetical protein [Asanoa ferruginea]REG01251.1 hypothetical protein DFJ67_7331 [Asanoa ferruginea]GIF53070.1 hypothetical protein Afe04nite_76090 [Asanoa ferruginea]
MQPRRLSYADAVRLLAGRDSEVVEWLGRAAGVPAAAATIASLGTVDFFALRGELVEWGHAAVSGVRRRLTGERRFDRTERLVAAHTVLVVTAFFEALDEAYSVDLLASEQVTLVTGEWPGSSHAQLVRALFEAEVPIPAPHRPFEAVLTDLADHYADVATHLSRFLKELSITAPTRRQLFAVIDPAVERYAEHFRALAAEVPEFGVWAFMADSQATRDAMRHLLDRTSGGATIDQIRTGLVARYRAAVERPLIGTSTRSTQVVLPTLERAYIHPQGQIASAGPSDSVATDAWWKDQAQVDDLFEAVVAHLSGPVATVAPMVVLGQPGSGKSVLTRVLAAGLPAVDFLPIRVELRAVPGDAPVQTQIERGIQQLLGEHLGWPELARRAGEALPVVFLDGFDELLQATGMNRADYLEEVEEFQRREAELGRPVAVVVTTRTVVADRARLPAGTVVVRIAPFSDAQVGDWLDVWNEANGDQLARRGFHPLPARAALAQGELARQPLLLLLLALYDAEDNALQRSRNASFDRVELYERLFAGFVDREVAKLGGQLSPEHRARAVDAEWRRLCAVALAMLNRGAEVITDAELDGDMGFLLTPADLIEPTAAPGGGRALTIGQLLVGRFFFVHESRAQRDTGPPEKSYEFLHATFGDFLAARLIVDALVELAAERVHQRNRRQPSLDAGYLYAATSFAVVARRGPLLDFVRGLLARLAPTTRDECRALALELLPDAGYPHPTWSLPGYEPVRRTMAARHAAFSANLAIFIVALSDGPVDVAEMVDDPVYVTWRQIALLWKSQLPPEDGKRLWQAFRVAWVFVPEGPPVLEIRPEDGSPVSLWAAIPWPPDAEPKQFLPTLTLDLNAEPESDLGRSLRQSGFMQTPVDNRELLYALVPYWRAFPNDEAEPILRLPYTNAFILFELMFKDTTPANVDDRESLYRVALQGKPGPIRRLVRARLFAEGNRFPQGLVDRLVSGDYSD